MARRVRRPRQLDLFAPALPAATAPQLGLGLAATPFAAQAQDVARNLAARQTRLAQLEQRRDFMRAQGWAVADLDDQIAHLRAKLLRDVWGSEARNPNFRSSSNRSLRRLVGAEAGELNGPTGLAGWDDLLNAPDEVTGTAVPVLGNPRPTIITLSNRGISPLPGTPGYSRNKMFRASGDHLLHPLRQNLLAQGIYNRNIENAHRNAKRAAMREGLIQPGESGSIGQIVERLRDRASQAEAAAAMAVEEPSARLDPGRAAQLTALRAALRDAGTRAERAHLNQQIRTLTQAKTAGLLEQRYGIARPSDSTPAGWERAWNAGRTQGRARRARQQLSDTEWLRIAAVVRESDPDQDFSSSDWADRLPYEDYREALRRSFAPGELAIGSRVNRAQASREARDAYRRADVLERRFLPHQRLDQLAKDYADALDSADFEHAEKLERQMKPLERHLAQLGGAKVQRAFVNPGGHARRSGIRRRWLAWWPIRRHRHNPDYYGRPLLLAAPDDFVIPPAGTEQARQRKKDLQRIRDLDLVATYGKTRQRVDWERAAVEPVWDVPVPTAIGDERTRRLTARAWRDAARSGPVRAYTTAGEGFALLPSRAPVVSYESGLPPSELVPMPEGRPQRAPEESRRQRSFRGPFAIEQQGFGPYVVTGPVATLPPSLRKVRAIDDAAERAFAAERAASGKALTREEAERRALQAPVEIGQAITLAGAVALTKPLARGGLLPAREPPGAAAEPARSPWTKESRDWARMGVGGIPGGSLGTTLEERLIAEAEQAQDIQAERDWRAALTEAVTEGERARQITAGKLASTDIEDVATGEVVSIPTRFRMPPHLLKDVREEGERGTAPEAAAEAPSPLAGRKLTFAHRSTRAITRPAAQLGLDIGVGAPVTTTPSPATLGTPAWQTVRVRDTRPPKPMQTTFLNPFMPIPRLQRNPLPPLWAVVAGSAMAALIGWSALGWWQRQKQLPVAGGPGELVAKGIPSESAWG